MYRATVREIKWSKWRGVRHKTIIDESAMYPEALIAKISPYQDDDRYQIFFSDNTEFYGTHDDREHPEPTAWDIEGNPVEDDRDKEAMREAARSARYYDEFGDELPF